MLKGKRTITKQVNKLDGLRIVLIYVYIFFISLVSSVRCFLFSFLSMRVLLVSAASWFGYVAVLSLYLSAYMYKYK